MGKRPQQNDDEMEFSILKSDLHETKELLRDIKILLVGNEELKTGGLKQSVETLNTSVSDLKNKFGDIDSRVVHIFKWRERYIANRKDQRQETINSVTKWGGIIGITWMIIQALIELKKIFEQ